MKKITVRCLVCAMLMAFVMAAAFPALAATTQVKATGTVNVRSGPGTNYTKLGQLSSGQVVNSTGTSGSWTIIEFEDGIGYVSSVYLTYVSGSSSNSSDSSAVIGVSQATGNVNVRSGPGTSYTRLGQLSRNAQVNFTGLSNGWYKIEYEDGVGYVSSTYMKTVSTSGSSVGSGSTSTTGQTMEAISNVNVRSGPSTSHSKLGQLKKGDKVEKKGSSSNWIMISYNGKTGYVRDDYLLPVLSNSSNNTTNNITVTSTLLYALRDTTVYANTITTSSRLAYLSTGDSVTHLADSGAWYKVQLGGTVGYVLASDMRKDDSATMTTINEYRVTLYASVPYYSSASTAYQLGILGNNISVYVQAANSTWARCTYNNQTVYIQVNNLSAGTANMTTVNENRVTLYTTVPYYSAANTANQIGALGKNITVYVQAVNSTWAKCTYNNQTVYIHVSNLSAGADNMATVNQSWTTLYGNVPYFAQASATSRLGSIAVGVSVYVQAANSTWARCTYNNQTVYIQVDYLSGGSDSMTAVNEYRNTIYSSVPYYSSASTANYLGTLPVNQSIYVQAANATWARCTYGGQTVYIQVSSLSAATDNSGYVAVNAYMTTTVSSVSYYATASTANVLGTLGYNISVYVLSQNSTWAKCTYGGQTVYIQRAYLGNDYGMTTANQGMYARYASVPCYWMPNSTASSNIAGYLSKNERVQMLAKDSQWAKCEIYDSSTFTQIIRYVQLSDLSATTVP